MFALTTVACNFIGIDENDTDEASRVPYNLRIEEKDGEEHLVWDWDGSENAQFVVIKSATDDPDDGFAITEALEDKKYPLEELDRGYYYWVRAYVGGYSSGLGNPFYLE